MSTYRPTEPSYKSALMLSQHMDEKARQIRAQAKPLEQEIDERYEKLFADVAAARARIERGERPLTEGGVAMQKLLAETPRRGLTGARRLKITGDGVVIALCLPFMAGLLYHRGYAAWVIVSAWWGCLVNGSGC